ncbi:hypothetical protein EJ08DRAFT_666491 [Tothia fuscella]|uniref:Adenylyltransferase and sulfurtransferase uba4 n=1 Tax=Tothia fuscella TaxID=1048955 RepID=A0A9P4NEE0_9PEZI|nr:hypothetical protein EJ08DRAFT_666491 [Tothia fuscella]
MDGGFPSDWRNDVLAALSQPVEEAPNTWPLTQQEYKRYGRQLIMPEIGLQGQLKLKNAKVLVIGVGGLGCPAIAYLAGAGVGTLGLVDGDVVEESNLHRQILHTVGGIGEAKVDSARRFVKELNPLVKIEEYKVRISGDNALQMIAPYDVVLDCTDTPASRYLISDSCVLLGKPLVSASALRTEGQLTIFNYPPRPAGDPAGGPCYRCIFPSPPPPEAVTSCGDGGILGPVVGVMGLLQALETIKAITAAGSADATAFSSFAEPAVNPPTMLTFSAYSSPQFRSIRLRPRKKGCASCSAEATVTAEALTSGSMDYIQFCGLTHPVNILTPKERVSALQYAEARKNISLSGKSHQVVDVREKVQFDLCHLYGSINVPFSIVSSLRNATTEVVQTPVLQQLKTSIGKGGGEPVFVVCRLGNDSQVAVRKFKELGFDGGGKIWIGDVRGGLKAWREDVDPSFPEY